MLTTLTRTVVMRENIELFVCARRTRSHWAATELSVHALDTVERRGNRIVTQTRNCAHDGRPHNVEGDGNNCENLDPVIFAGNNVE